MVLRILAAQRRFESVSSGFVTSSLPQGRCEIMGSFTNNLPALLLKVQHRPSSMQSLLHSDGLFQPLRVGNWSAKALDAAKSS